MRNISIAIFSGLLTSSILDKIINKNFVISRSNFIMFCSLLISYSITKI